MGFDDSTGEFSGACVDNLRRVLDGIVPILSRHTTISYIKDHKSRA